MGKDMPKLGLAVSIFIRLQWCQKEIEKKIIKR